MISLDVNNAINVNIVIFLDVNNAINVVLDTMVMLIEPHPFIPPRSMILVVFKVTDLTLLQVAPFKQTLFKLCTMIISL